MSLKKYKDVLKELESTNENCHLLIGNGFNNSLGINTSYKNIFKEMKKDYPEYFQHESFMENNFYDVELLINELKDALEKTNDQYNFLCKFIESKVKFDFMKACYSIVKEQIKGVYQEKNEGIYLLFKNFINFFSLNYDPFLYLLLMRFKKTDNQAVAFQNTFSFIKEALDTQQSDIYTEIQKARTQGTINITIDEDNHTMQNLKQISKNEFETVIKTHFKQKGWKTTDIKKVCGFIWENEKRSKKLEYTSDGFLFDIYDSENSKPNIFFLHGAFHICVDKNKIFKITQKQNKAFYEKLEEVINSQEEDIVCVLTNKSEDKEAQIKDNLYLKNSFNELSKIDGSLVLFGSSLAENDKHIFEQINKSNISKIYITTNENNHSEDSKKASKIFPKKDLCFFDYTTVSYDKINNESECDE